MSEHSDDKHTLSVNHPRRTAVHVLSGDRPDEDSAGSSFTLGFLWYVVQRWGKFAIPCGIVGIVLGIAIVLFLFEPQYKSESILQIRTQRPMVVTRVEDGGYSEFVETQKHLLKSIPVLNKVLANPEVARMPELRRERDPRVWIEKNLEVRPIGRSDLFSVAYQGPNPENCRLVVDTVVQAYFALQSTQSNDQIRKLLGVLRDLKEEQLAKVSRLEKQLQESAKKLSTESAFLIDPSGHGLLEINPTLRDLQQRLGQAEVDRHLIEAQVKAIDEDGEAPAPTEKEIDEAVAASQEVLDIEQKIGRTRKELGKLQPNSANYKTAEIAIREYESELKTVQETVRQALVEQYDEKVKAARHEGLSRVREVVREHRVREETLRTKVEEERRKVEGKAGGRYELEFLRNDLARAKQVAEKIEDRDFALTIEYLSPQRPEQVSVIQPAEVPPAPLQAYPLKQLTLASLAGFFLPLAVFGIFELLSNRLYRADQLQDSTKLTLVGEIAALPSRPLLTYGRAERRYIRERAIFEESVESLRSFLAVSPEWSDVAVLAISSAVAGEGKTSLASQLATSWSRQDQARTLIVDGDVRDPDLHTVFGIRSSPGLADVLAGKCDLSSAIVNWDDNLAILPAGTLESSPHRLFGSNGFAELIESAKQNYTRIIIDVAPLLCASEVLPMLKTADGVLLCARKDHSRTVQVRLACERLQGAGIRRVGAVFSGLSNHSYSYQYGDYIG